MHKKILRRMLWIIAMPLAFVVLYWCAALLLSRISIAAENSAADDLTIYIKTNGVHTDIVMPAIHPLRNWTDVLPVANTRACNSIAAQFIGIGWGDKGFYLETPTWADLKLSTAFKAAFWLSSSALHATYYEGVAEDKTALLYASAMHNT